MTGYRLEWKPRAVKDGGHLDSQTCTRIVKAVERLAATGAGDVVRLKGVSPAEYRLRVGDWRVRFARDDVGRVLTVLRILHRAKAYE